MSPYHYWLKFEGTTEAGLNSASPLIETGSFVSWLFNVDAADPLSVRVFSTGAPQPPQPSTQTVTYQWVSPSGQPEAPQTLTAMSPPGIDSPIPPPANVSPGVWTLMLRSGRTYQLEKTS